MTLDISPIPFNGTKSLDDLPSVILGCGVFNYQYHTDPLSLPAYEVIQQAFKLGFRAIDTSAYYGPSEQIVGEALEAIKEDYPRESYFICTKAGREGLDQFDYKPEQIRASVMRSLERLKTDYIDVLYIHDVEFVDTKKCLEAIGEAFRLKNEGVVRYVGISGYPVDFLLYLAKRCKLDISPLDVVLSYSNFCIQNTRLGSYAQDFYTQAGVSKLINASPLSMSLLRSAPTHSFHPAPKILKERVAEAAKFTASNGVELADLASRFAFRNWKGCTVFGLQRTQEVDQAAFDYWQAQDADVTDRDEVLVTKVRQILGETLDMTWPSGIDHDEIF